MMLSKTKLLNSFASIVIIVLLASVGFHGLFLASASADSQAPITAQCTGNIVSIYGDMIIVGNPSASASVAYICDATTGKLVESLRISNPQAFGGAVAINGKIAVVSDYFQTVKGHPEAGAVYLFNITTGKLIRTLTSPDAQNAGLFGFSVALDHDIIIVGAPQEASGNAYTFDALTGKLIQKLSSPDPSSFGGWFGWSVAFDGNIAVVGAPGEHSTNGRAYVFNGISGKLIDVLKDPHPSRGGFGYLVAKSGSIVAVSADDAVNGLVGAGAVYIFNISQGPKLIATLVDPNPERNGEFGSSISMFGGGVIAVGDPNDSINNTQGVGRVFIFQATIDKLVRILASPVVQFLTSFGTSVAVDGKFIVVSSFSMTLPPKEVNIYKR
jgi:hypothetical protein